MVLFSKQRVVHKQFLSRSTIRIQAISTQEDGTNEISEMSFHHNHTCKCADMF